MDPPWPVPNRSKPTRRLPPVPLRDESKPTRRLPPVPLRDESPMADDAKAKGNACLQAKDFDGAIGHYTTAIGLDGSNHTYYSNRAAAYMSKSEPAKALGDAEMCIKLNPTWAKGYSHKGAALHALKKYDEADAAYQAGLAVAPGDVEVFARDWANSSSGTARSSPRSPRPGSPRSGASWSPSAGPRSAGRT